jgi:aspartate/methionine/tyrosine aminotransferase
MLNVDNSWRTISSPDFTVYEALDPERKILLNGADLFFPDPCLPDHVIEATKRALDEGRTHYSLANGYAEPELREALVGKLKSFNDMDVDPETELLVIPSSALGLYLAIRVCITPNTGDEVLNISPGFAENINDVVQMGAKNVLVPVKEENAFHIDPQDIESRITEHTRCLVLTNPNNPTAVVYTREELTAVAQILERHNLIAVVDQDFERQVYDGSYTTFANLPGMRERTITVFGTSKDLGLTGFRVGYMVVPRELFGMLKIAIFNMHGPTNTFAQIGAAAAYDNPAYADAWVELMRERRACGQAVLDKIPGVRCPLPEGGFYFWVNIRALGTSEDVRDWLIHDAQIGVGLGTWFGADGEGFLRIMYGAVPDEVTYKEGIRRIDVSLRKLAQKQGIVA